MLLLGVAGAADGRFDKAASVIDVAADGNPQRAVGAAVRFERGLVSVGKAEDGEIGRQDVTGRIDLDRAFGRTAGTFDDQILEAGHHRRLDEREGCAAGPARSLHPSGQQIVDFGLGQIGLDGKAAVGLRRRHASAELDRHRPGQKAADIEAEFVARVLVERGLDADIGVAVARLAIIERGGNAVDLDVAADPLAQIVGTDLEQCGLDLLAHDHTLGGEVRDVQIDRVERRPGREILFERQRERHLRGQRAAAGRGFDRRPRIFAQPFHSQELSRSRHRSVEAEAGFRRRRLGEGVGHLEHAVGDGELAARRYVDVPAAEIDRRRAAGNAHVEVGVANRGQALDRPDLGAVADDLDQQAVVGNRRAARLDGRPRRVGRDVEPVHRAALDMIVDPGAHLRRGADRPKPLQGRHRHARAGDAERQPRIVARKIKTAVERDPKLGVAQLARLEIDALLAGVDLQPQQDAVENERSWIGRSRGEHDRAAGDLHPPHGVAFARGVELCEQRKAIAAGYDLERHDQALARRVPVEIDLGTIDRNARERIVQIDDDALLHQDTAVEHVRNAVGPDIGSDARRDRQIRLELAFAPAHGEHQVLGRDFVGVDIDDAVAIPARRHRGAHLPRSFDAVGSQRECDAAALGPRHAQIDVGERPLLAIALIVNREIAVLEPDFSEVAAVQPLGIETLDPGEQRGKVGNAIAGGRGSSRRRGGRGGRRHCGARRSPFDLCRCRRACGRGAMRGCRSGDEGALVAAGKDRDRAVRLDAHRHLGADQAQPFGADAPGEQSRARDTDFRLRRARHDGAFGVAHHDVADAQRRAGLARVALELGAADLDLIVVAEILLDRRGQPRRRDIELDWTTGQAPPQRNQRQQDEAAERAADNDECTQTRPPPAQPHRRCAGGGRVPAQLRVHARLQRQERLQTRIGLPNRHAPTWRPLDPDSAARASNNAYGEPAPCRSRRVQPQTIDLTAFFPRMV